MAFKRLFAQRLCSISRITNAAVTNCRVCSPCTAAHSKSLNQTPASKLAPDPGDDRIFRRYLHRQSAAVSTFTAPPFLPTGEKLLEKLREMDVARDRIKLDGLRLASPTKAETSEAGLTVKDAVKILKLSQLEFVRSRLRQIGKDRITHSEFLEICSEECSSVDQTMEFARMLDRSGSVIVLGNIVFLRPEQVVKAIQGLIPVTHRVPNDPRTEELQEMEKEKASIDNKARSLVQRELWGGLAYFIVQTAAFMRLTFWELSWDVMEPICCYVTSIYFIGGYMFFLRTSKEPTFEGFFQSRFSMKQKRLMMARKFDVERYNDLKEACGANSPITKISCH